MLPQRGKGCALSGRERLSRSQLKRLALPTSPRPRVINILSRLAFHSNPRLAFSQRPGPLNYLSLLLLFNFPFLSFFFFNTYQPQIHTFYRFLFPSFFICIPPAYLPFYRYYFHSIRFPFFYVFLFYIILTVASL